MVTLDQYSEWLWTPSLQSIFPSIFFLLALAQALWWPCQGWNQFLMQSLIFQIGRLGWGLSDFWWGLYWPPFSWEEDWFGWVWFERGPWPVQWERLTGLSLTVLLWDWEGSSRYSTPDADDSKAEMLKGSVEPSSRPHNGWYWAWEEFSLGSRRTELEDIGVLGGVGTMSLH